MPFFARTPSNRLKLPATLIRVPFTDLIQSGTTINWCGMPVAKVGDYVHIYGSGVSAGTVGKLLSIENLSMEGHAPEWSGFIETLDGKIREQWLWAMTPLTEEALQEVKDFYIQDSRSKRIKVSW